QAGTSTMGWATNGGNRLSVHALVVLNPKFKQEVKEPVILVPGIMGSYLYSSIDPGVEVWPAVIKTVADPWDFHLNQLIMDSEGRPSANSMIVPPQDIIRNVLDKDFFAGLIDELKQNGYEENKNLFVFPYDWRLDLNWTANGMPYSGFDSLKDKVEKVKAQTGASKINIIAHSMGGLVAKNYIKHYGASSVNKFIDIGTPHLGAPEALKILMYGDDLGYNFNGYSLLNLDRVKIISQNFPSVYQLLPSHNYFDSADPDYAYYIYDLHDLDNNSITGRLNYDQSIDFMKNTGRNNYLLGFNDTMHSDLDNYSPISDGIKTYNIIGCGRPTLGQIFVLNKEQSGGYEYGLKYITGDGTVPLRSAKALAADDSYYVRGAEHGVLPATDGIKQIAAAILKDTIGSLPLQNYPAVSRSSVDCSLTGTQISFHSPIELNVYDENNNHIGPNANGDIELNIAGAQYDNLDGNKFVFLPVGHNYQVVGSSTATGSFNARVQTVQDGQYTQTVYYNEVPLNSSSTVVQLQINNGQPSGPMALDQNGDQVFETTAQPSSILNEQESADLAKPKTTINISEAQGKDNWHTSLVQISLTASDEGGSGILKTEYSLDNGQTWQVYADTINLDKQGANKILFKSTDKAGNIEAEQTKEFKIDSIMPNSNSIVIGTMGQNNWYTSDVQISLSAEDGALGSGLDKIEYSTDNGSTWQIYNQVIVIHNDGKSNILYRALDKAGNQTGNKAIAIQIDQTPPTLEMITPLANDEYDHAENLEILYNNVDNVSGLDNSATKLQVDGQDMSTTSIDLFPYHLGSHQLIVKTFDLAGNQIATTVSFSVITSIPGTIDDIKRLYSEKQIFKTNVKDKLIRELNSLQQYLERFGKRQDKRLSKYQERLAKCDKKKKSVAECREFVKKLYERREYVLNKVHAKIIANRLADLLKDLEKYYSKKWLTPRAYEMIKEGLIYLKNNL
ncbi:MAG: alpha/beta fold hydrolase, partial [Parcubacteria group bacterium]|nr:alpha/beta fold hydrolase [Parcubacteria group bacterium]